MKKIILISTLLLLIASAASAQQGSDRFVRAGLFRSMATLSSGAMLGAGVTNIYIQGNFDYYVDASASIRNDGYFFVNTLGNSQLFNMNHSLFSGGSYHFKTKGNLDPYFAIQPGLAISSVWLDPCPTCAIEPTTHTKSTASPLISGVAGINYYAQKFFHFFLETRYVQGKHLAVEGPVSLNELKFSFGLGWNINTKKAQ